MKILLAPDKFKGSLSAKEVCDAMIRGIRKFDASIEVIKCPLADGGEGTLALLEEAMNLERVHLNVNDPLFRPINSYYLLGQDQAYIEMAKASGLQLLLPEERNPLSTSTYGTGELIKDAFERGVRGINLFIGGSATNDGGVGMAKAMGFQFKTGGAEIIKPTGNNLIEISEVDDSFVPALDHVEFNVLCDVQNPLYGENGAAHIYAGQKGANIQEIEQLDNGLRNLAGLLSNGLENVPGSGAAGGLGYGAMSFLKAGMKSGIEFMLQVTGFNSLVQEADLVITGEGKLDHQSLEGKAVGGVLKRARQAETPVGIICGQQAENQQTDALLTKMLIDNKTSSETAMKEAPALLEQRTFEMIQELKTTIH